jgi:amino acid transporter
VLSGYIILEAARAEASAFTLVRMVTNVGIDTLLGAVPALGDLFDAAWKSNTKNVALLERHLATGETAAAGRNRSNVGSIALIVVALVIILGAGLALGIYVARLLWNLGTR